MVGSYVGHVVCLAPATLGGGVNGQGPVLLFTRLVLYARCTACVDVVYVR